MTELPELPQNELEDDIAAAGQPLSEPAFEDYFGFEERHQWFFPDGKQYIEFKTLSEGDRAKYQKETSRDITLRRSTGDASLRVDPGEERKILVFASVTGWLIYKKGETQPERFTTGRGGTFSQWYDKANPKLIDSLVDRIREQNPWLVTDNMTVEEIDREIDRLDKLKETIQKTEAGKVDS